MRKGGEYRKTTMLQKSLSMLRKDEMQAWFCSFWTDIKGASTRDGHPAPYPVELAERLLGTGSTTIAAVRAGRNSIGNEIEPKYLKLGWERVRKELDQPRLNGGCEAVLV
jgi:DNA modification methylase